MNTECEKMSSPVFCESPSFASSLGWFCNRAALVLIQLLNWEKMVCAHRLLVFGVRLTSIYHICSDDQNLKLILHNAMCQMYTQLGSGSATIFVYLTHIDAVTSVI